MPLYEFVCQTCGQPFDKLLRMTQADQPQDCPACGSQDSRRGLSTFAFSGISQPKTAARPARSPFT